MEDKKYIDYDLLEELYHKQVDLGSTPQEAYEDATQDAIAYNVAEVKHGKWIPFQSQAAGDIQYCSDCKIGSADKMAYCPHCGARMDGWNAVMSIISEAPTVDIADISPAPTTSGKSDAGKPRLALVPSELIEAVGAVRTYGTEKYGSADSWRTISPERYRDALMRHICAYLKDPAGADAESGLPHLWHVACNVAFLIALEDKK